MRLIGFDCETYLISKGRLIPRLVCLTLAGDGTPPPYLADEAEPYNASASAEAKKGRWTGIFNASDGIEVFRRLVIDPDVVLVAHHAVYDLAVMAEADAVGNIAHEFGGLDALGRPTILQSVFTALAEGRVRDTMIREQLLAIALDRLRYDPRTSRPSLFSLAALVEAYFGVDLSADKKGPDAWRLRYAELDGVPVEDWPTAARDYAIDDAVWVLDVHRIQAEPMDADNDQPIAVGPGDTTVTSHAAGELGYVVDEDNQLRAAWALHLMAAWGLRTDVPRVEAWATVLEAHVAEGEAIAKAAGFLRTVESVRTSGLRDLITEAYDGSPPVTPSGRPQTSRTVLEASGHPDLIAWASATPQGKTEIARRKGFLDAKTTVNKKALGALVEEAYGDAVERTPTGLVRTSREILEGSGDPNLVTYAASGVDRRSLSTHLPILRSAGQYAMTSSPSVLGSRSGRTSWSRPPLQQPPREGPFRACFVPRPGCVYVSCDYSGAELVAMAQILLWGYGENTMADAIRAGRDLHVELAAGMLGITYEEAWVWHEAGKLPERQEAKPGNFGFMGGLGADTFAVYCKSRGVDLSLGGTRDAIERAEEIRDAWFELRPKMRRYFEQISSASQWGRFTASQFVSKRQRGGCSFTSGANTYFQGLIADGAKRACWDLSKACYVDRGVFEGVRPVLFVHDEILAEGPEETVHLWGDGMARVMVDALQPYVPDLPVVAEPAAMRRWDKNAKTVRDAAGRLVVWEPEL